MPYDDIAGRSMRERYCRAGFDEANLSFPKIKLTIL
jgi:hypothetical protein